MTDNFKYYEDNIDISAVSQFDSCLCLPSILGSGNGIPSYFEHNHSNIVPKHLNTMKYIGVLGDISMYRNAKYGKIEYMERPLTIKRNKLWSLKCPFSNSYRGKEYNGFVEFYIYEPHLIDVEQSWYYPTITVNVFSGINAKFDFTWEQFEESPFYNLVSDLEQAYCIYRYVCKDYTTGGDLE